MIGFALAAALSIYDLVEVELGYTTIADRAYRNASSVTLLDGARSGMLAYLRSRGVTQPQVGLMRAKPDGRGAVPAIDREIALAIRRYGARVEPRPLAYAIIRGELAALHDPYAVLFTPAELTSFTKALDGERFGGIGAVLLADDAARGWRVDDVFPGSPAEKAGLRGGDLVVAVNATPLAGKPLDAALLRGAIGTTVRLTVERGGVELAPITVARAAVSPPDVQSRLLGTVGYVALRGFGPTSGVDVRRAVAALDARGATATVLDLRGNGGGYESQAVRVASVFIAAGPVVRIEEPRKRRVENATGGALPARPLAVLVDRDSASGSELVAAALRDRGLAVLVGARTFGKGLVQEITPLPDGAALKFTTARYLPPSGRDLDRVGITPDLEIAQPADAQRSVPGRDPQLDAALARLAAPSPARSAPL